MSFVQINNAKDTNNLGFGNEWAAQHFTAGSPAFEDLTGDTFGDGTQSVQTWTGSVNLINIKIKMRSNSSTTTTMQIY